MHNFVSIQSDAEQKRGRRNKNGTGRGEIGKMRIWTFMKKKQMISYGHDTYNKIKANPFQ